MIEDEIRENRRRVSRSLATDRRPSVSAGTGISLSPIPVDCEAKFEIYTRDVSETAIIGHSDAASGIGRGEIGDTRAAWSKQQTVTTDLDRPGREAIVDALVGNTVEIAAVDAGDEEVLAWPVDNGDGSTIGRGSYRFDGTPDTVSTVILRTGDGRDIATGDVDVTAGSDVELRCDVTLTFSDDSRTDSEAVTDLSLLGKTLRLGSAGSIDSLAVGTDGTDPSTTDTSLGSKEVERSATLIRRGADILVETTVFRSEPSGQPVDIKELGVKDDSNNLMLRATFSAVAKDNRIRLEPRSGLQIDP